MKQGGRFSHQPPRSNSRAKRESVAAANTPHRAIVALDRHGAAAHADVTVAIDAPLTHDRTIIVAVVAIARLTDPYAANRRIDGKLRKRRNRGEHGRGRDRGGRNQKGFHGRFSVVVPAPITAKPLSGSME